MITHHFSKHLCKNCRRILLQHEKNFFQSSIYFGIFNKSEKKILSYKQNNSFKSQKYFEEISILGDNNLSNFNRWKHDDQSEVANHKKVCFVSKF